MYDRLWTGSMKIIAFSTNSQWLWLCSGQPQPSGTEHTRIMPFIALDLLTDEAWEGKIARQYPHDCESFAWVLLWICNRCNSGKDICNAPLGELITPWLLVLQLQKFCILSMIITPTSSYEQFWLAAQELLGWPLDWRYAKDWRGPQQEPKIDDVVQIYCNALEKKGSSRVLWHDWCGQISPFQASLPVFLRHFANEVMLYPRSLKPIIMLHWIHSWLS